MVKTYISQGEYAVTDQSDEVISTILGSCVAACLWDPVAKIGGMNHILLPDGGKSTLSVSSFGANAMELLINALIKKGAMRHRLQAQVLGGAKMHAGLSNAGAENGSFVLEYLASEAIPVENQSLGGTRARRLEYQAASGALTERFVEDVSVKESRPQQSATTSVELF